MNACNRPPSLNQTKKRGASLILVKQFAKREFGPKPKPTIEQLRMLVLEASM